MHLILAQNAVNLEWTVKKILCLWTATVAQEMFPFALLGTLLLLILIVRIGDYIRTLNTKVLYNFEYVCSNIEITILCAGFGVLSGKTIDLVLNEKEFKNRKGSQADVQKSISMCPLGYFAVGA